MPVARTGAVLVQYVLAKITSQLDILRHDSHPLGVNGTQVGILAQSDQIRLGGFLKRENSRALEVQVGLEVLSDLTDQALKGKLAEEQLRGLLVFADLAKSHGTGAVTVRLPDSTGGQGGLASGLGRELFAGRLASGLLGIFEGVD